ncbi:alpha/beta hydrolase domain-containing protein [Mycolicibacterium aichiense]|uniref:alpha/beta hydrolase domain-containing protein n=1 Tax=Mycolicibacterium aichiense TaxID=1799 RepID=UPI003D66B2F4
MRVGPPPVGGGSACTTATVDRHVEGMRLPALDHGYLESEYLWSGQARTYAGSVTGPVTPSSSQYPYTTRVLVRRPRDPASFSGRVLVEPFNITYGVDLDVLWCRLASTLQSEGDGWVGVTVRAASVDVLKAADPARYFDLAICTNDLEWDMLTEIGRSLRSADGPLGDLSAQYVYLGGYSQSALDTATFASAFHRNARLPGGAPVYDGYFPAAHAAALTAVAGGAPGHPAMETARIQPVDVPLVDVQPQSDVEGFTSQVGSHVLTIAGSASLRRHDSDMSDDRYRLYEVAGAAHAAHVDGCDGVGSSFPTAAILRAAYRNMIRWAEVGLAPPRAPRIELATSDVVSVAAVDAHGNPLGGLRSPFIDVPLVTYAVHSSPGPLCKLAGDEKPLPAQELRRLYGDVTEYLRRFTVALDAAIDGGFLLAADRSALLDDARIRAHRAFTAPVPDTLAEALSPGWLTAALQPRFPGVEVNTVTPGPIVDRISTNARFAITCAGELPPGLPAQLCVKGYFNEIGRTARSVGEAEALFYRDVASRTGVHTLRSVYADVDPATRHGVVVTADVAADGGRFLDGRSIFTLDQVAECLRQLALLHARTWLQPSLSAQTWLAPKMGRVLDIWGVERTTSVIAENLHGRRGHGVPPRCAIHGGSSAHIARWPRRVPSSRGA